MARARNWRDVRSDALQAGLITEDGLAEARHQHDDRMRAFRLRQIREAQSARQEDVAKAMHVSQSRVSRIEKGDIEHVEVATLRAYIQALGGQIRIVADFGDEQLRLA